MATHRRRFSCVPATHDGAPADAERLGRFAQRCRGELFPANAGKVRSAVMGNCSSAILRRFGRVKGRGVPHCVGDSAKQRRCALSFDRVRSAPSHRPTGLRRRATAVPAWRRDRLQFAARQVRRRSREPDAIGRPRRPARAARKPLCGSPPPHRSARRPQSASYRAFLKRARWALRAFDFASMQVLYFRKNISGSSRTAMCTTR